VTLPPAPVLGHPADYVIVTSQSLAAEFDRLARWKTRGGLPTLVKPIEEIRAEYPAGRDDAERVRLFLRDAHTQWGTHWALLGGNFGVIPVRKAHSTFFGGLDVPSDLYYACLDGDWDADGDGIFGEGFVSNADPGDNADLDPELAVGRAPVGSPAEAHTFVDKSIHADAVPFTPQSYRALLRADVLFPSNWVPGTLPTLDGAELAEFLKARCDLHPDIVLTRFYQNNAPYPGSLPMDKAAFLDSLDAGQNLYIYFGFGGPMVDMLAHDSLTAADVGALTNASRSLNVLGETSLDANIDGDCLAAAWLLNPHGGAATVTGPTSYGFVSAMRYYGEEWLRLVLDGGVRAAGEALNQARLPFVTYSLYDGVNRLTEMELVLVGDPTTPIYVPPLPPPILELPAALATGSHGFDVAVRDQQGGPIAGAKVSACLEEVGLAVATTGVDGRAHLDLEAGEPGHVTVIATTADGVKAEGSVNVSDVLAVGVSPAARLRLDPPAPNPAAAGVTLRGTIPAGAGAAELGIYDLSGRQVLSFGRFAGAGPFTRAWDLRDAAGTRVSAGLYFARLRAGEARAVGRILVLP
jgi:hypothetical protein